jgi:hypothetical protein
MGLYATRAVFLEKVKTSRVFIRDCTPVVRAPPLLP